MEEDKVKENEELKEVAPIEPTVEPTVDNEDDYSEDDFDSDSGLLTGVRYNAPEDADKFIDSKDGSVIDKENLTPFQIIKTIAKQNNQTIKDPNKSCKFCYGRGFDGRDAATDMPIPCRCLFRGKTDKEKEAERMHDAQRLNGKMNHDQQRRMKLALYKQFKRQRKLLRNKPINQNAETENVEDETKQNERIENILKNYLTTNSLKKSASMMAITLTEMKKIVKENKEKLETLRKE
jgi:hypothetical protein